MDFSSVRAALDSKSYDKVADVCDNLMLQVPISIYNLFDCVVLHFPFFLIRVCVSDYFNTGCS